MSDSLFHEGGPHNITRIDRHRYQMRIDLPKGEDGLIARECPDDGCSPGYFKVRLGTGITSGQEVAYCPYCRRGAAPNDFATRAQVEYAKRIIVNEVEDGVSRVIQEAMGLGPTGEKTIGGGMFSMKLSYKPSGPKFVAQPLEEELRRDVKCPNCTLEHSVFGLAIWCADCGADIFLSHVEEEFAVVRKMAGAVDSRRKELGARVAARDVENALEDVVSTFEAVLKILSRRYMVNQGKTEEEIESIFRRKIGNRFQNIATAAVVFKEIAGIELFHGVEPDYLDRIRLAFEKRHPVTHNLGVVDRKYLDRARSGELQGREVRVEPQEVSLLIDFCLHVIRRIYVQLFSAPAS